MSGYRLALAATVAASSSAAMAYDINGYAVGNHRPCGASNLPGTIAELDKFFASTDFPEDARKNFLWKDGRVRVSEWASAGDRFESRETANGFDGADAGLIAYIASHGITTAAKYTAYAGGGTSGCKIENTSMGLGDQTARYLILSTCQGLKIGNGDDPTRPGENPSITWRTGNNGMNCILGYSNNMVDADTYGTKLLANLASTDDTLADAFFKASREISFSNVPAVLCFGVDDADARQHLDTAKRFTEERYGSGGSAWRYQRSRMEHDAYRLHGTRLPRNLVMSPLGVKASRLARELLGKDVQEQSPTRNLAVYRGAQGLMTYQGSTGALHWRRDGGTVRGEAVPKDAVAIRIARDFITARGLVKDAGEDLAVTYVLDTVDGSAGGVQQTVAKTVVFHQRLHGLAPLGAAGSVEVTITGGGEVTSLVASLQRHELPRIPEWIETKGLDLSTHKQEALEELQRRDDLEGAAMTVVETRVGYEVDTDKSKARAVVEVLVEAEKGGVARRYTQVVDL